MSSIFGLRSSYMLEYRWLFAVFLRSPMCFTGAEGKWTPLPPISPPSSSENILEVSIFLIFKNMLFIYFWREGREIEKERERNINMWLPLACPPTGDLAHNPGMCPDWESNLRPFGSQSSAQSTAPHQPGPTFLVLNPQITDMDAKQAL